MGTMLRPEITSANYVDFIATVGQSKRLLRTGWLREKVKNPESVAEHSFRVGVLAMVLADKLETQLDITKIVKMALLHDLGEVVTGDIVTERGEIVDLKKRDEKEQKEREGIREIFDKIGDGDIYVAIFDEMIGRVTPEAKIFWQLDKLEMAAQAAEYEIEQNLNLGEFFTTVEAYMRDPLMKRIFDQLIEGRRVGKRRRKKA